LAGKISGVDFAQVAISEGGDGAVAVRRADKQRVAVRRPMVKCVTVILVFLLFLLLLVVAVKLRSINCHNFTELKSGCLKHGWKLILFQRLTLIFLSNVMILKIFWPKNSAKKLVFLTRNKAKFCKILIVTLVFKKNANFFAENWRKSQKIVIITSVPGYRVLDFYRKITQVKTGLTKPDHLNRCSESWRSSQKALPAACRTAPPCSGWRRPSPCGTADKRASERAASSCRLEQNEACGAL
jgi:hypothetical protein